MRVATRRGPSARTSLALKSAPAEASSELESATRGTSDPDKPPSFYFAEGAARGDQALWGKAFDLLFQYGRVTADALVSIKETRLDQVKAGEVALGVEVVPKGLTLAKGGAFRLVKFKDGAMVGEPPRFALKAPERDDAELAPVGVYVTFTVKGAVVYSFFLGIELVEQLSDTPRPPRTVDLDLEEVRASAKVEPRNAWLTIRKKGGPWEIYGGIYGSDDDLFPT